MPYLNDKSKKFEELLNQAMEEVGKEPNFKTELEDAELPESYTRYIDKNPIHFIKRTLTNQSEEVWKSVEAKIISLNSVKERLEKAELELERAVTDFMKNNEISGDAPRQQKNQTIETLNLNEETELEENLNPEASRKISAYRRMMEQELGISRLRDESKKLEDEIDLLLFQELKERIRFTINDIIKDNYDLTLKIFEAPGLAEVIDPTRTIDTEAKISLIYKLNHMSGGSIGIAGSRGAGKSTLIQLCCGDDRKIEPIEKGKSIPIFTTAPVQYESRDFILYLFSVLCQRVLDPEMKGVLETMPAIKDYSHPPISKSLLNKFLNEAPRILFLLGITLLVLTVVLVILPYLFTTSAPSSNTQTANQNTAQSNIQTTNQNVSENAVQSGNQNSAPSNIQAASSPSPQPKPASTAETILKTLEIKPGAFLYWGVFLLLLGLVVVVFKRKFAAELELFPRDYEEYAAATTAQQQKWLQEARLKLHVAERWRRTSPAIIRWWLDTDLREEEAKALLKSLESYETRRESEKKIDTLEKKAKYWQDEIKFQQNFTSGWTGGLKLPVGMEAGVNRTIEMSKRQMTNPEIVSSFIKFLKEVVTDGNKGMKTKVIIGIDEMDKMESDEDAKKFLNEIKSIFGLPDCFYLISVSEHAMSNFERRGLAFRDVFDSSFDDVVYVEHLNSRSAKDLLLNRITGKPLPFIYLCYCLAGGLPRDLIRYFRNLIEFNQLKGSPDGQDLETLCRAIITKEIKAKVRAMSAAVRKIKTEPERSGFLEILVEIERQTPSKNFLLNSVESLFKWRNERQLTAEAGDDEKEDFKNCREIEKISKELGCYIYFLATIFEFFDNSLNKEELIQIMNNGNLENLAKARQLMEVNPNTTITILNDFRTTSPKIMKLPKIEIKSAGSLTEIDEVKSNGGKSAVKTVAEIPLE